MGENTDLVDAEIFTQHHRYVGKVDTHGRRLADLLNDATTDVLEMSEVRVSQPSNPLSQPLECPRLQLRKESIILTIPTGSYEAPTKRLYSYIEKQHYQAHIMLPGCHLVGIMHLPDRVNRWELLCEGSTTPSFVPITDVAVQFATRDFERFQRKVVIFRRQKIESLFISERPLNPSCANGESAALPHLDASELAREFAKIQSTLNSSGEAACSNSLCLFREVS